MPHHLVSPRSRVRRLGRFYFGGSERVVNIGKDFRRDSAGVPQYLHRIGLTRELVADRNVMMTKDSPQIFCNAGRGKVRED
jgi:hypothetical protein